MFQKCFQTKFDNQDITNAVAIAAVEASYRTKASAIVVLTSSGNTARLVSKFRPTCPVVAVSRCQCFKTIPQ
jgi:pyruvate kinase